jgi:hypothetical protein
MSLLLVSSFSFISLQLQALPQKLIRRQNHHHCSIDVTQPQMLIFGICQRSKAI